MFTQESESVQCCNIKCQCWRTSRGHSSCAL